MKKKLLRSLLLLTVAISGCTKNMEKNSSLAIHLPSLNLSIDPHKMQDAYSMTAVIQLYRGLFRYSPEGELKPDFAKSWVESDDHKTITFKLREAQFSNGTPVTAANVRASFARIFALGSSIGADIDYIQGSKAYRRSKHISDLGIKAIDEKTVQFQLERPSALLFKHLATADCAILPILNTDDIISENESLVASGPFRISARTGESIKLVRWRPDNLDSPNPPNSVEFFLAKNPEPETLLREGKTDSFDDDRIAVNFGDKLKAKGWKQYVTEIARERFVIMHPGRIAMSTRQYLASRVDPEVIKSGIPVSFLTPSFGLIPTGIAGELSKGDAADYKQSIRATSSPKYGSFSLTYANDDEISAAIAKALEQTWTTSTFKIQLDPIDRATLLSRMFKKDFDLILGGKGVDYPDGYSVLTYFKSGYEGNYFHVHSREIDADLNRLVTTFDQGERESGYRKLQVKILKEFTLIPLFFGSPSSGFWSPRVSSVPSHPMGLHTLPLETVEMK